MSSYRWQEKGGFEDPNASEYQLLAKKSSTFSLKQWQASMSLIRKKDQ